MYVSKGMTMQPVFYVATHSFLTEQHMTFWQTNKFSFTIGLHILST